MDLEVRRLLNFHRPQRFNVENFLVDELVAGNISRRDFIRRASAIGISLPVVGLILEACGSSSSPSTAPNGANGIPQVTVRWCNLPYWDTCTAHIGVVHGWFTDVGISLEPSPVGISLTSNDDAVAVYASGNIDVMQFPASGLMPAIATAPPFKMFAVTDIYEGWAVMAQPNAGYKTFKQVVATGVPAAQAFTEVIGQMRGKRFAYPPGSSEKGFIDLVFQKGGFSLSGVQSLVNADAQNVALMMAGRADFQVGGGPSLLTLTAAGFIPIVSSDDFASAAQASANSPELQAVLYNGFTASDAWLKANHDTALRLASVNFRINNYINTSPSSALADETPFLNSIAGTSFNDSIGQAAYSSLDPFLTFDMQKAIFDDTTNPLNIQYVTGAAILTNVQSGVFKAGQYTWSDFVNADVIYHELVSLKAQSDQSIKDATTAIQTATGSAKLNAEHLLATATLFSEWNDFLDSSRIAAQALKAAKG